MKITLAISFISFIAFQGMLFESITMEARPLFSILENSSGSFSFSETDSWERARYPSPPPPPKYSPVPVPANKSPPNPPPSSKPSPIPKPRPSPPSPKPSPTPKAHHPSPPPSTRPSPIPVPAKKSPPNPFIIVGISPPLQLQPSRPNMDYLPNSIKDRLKEKYSQNLYAAASA